MMKILDLFKKTEEKTILKLFLEKKYQIIGIRNANKNFYSTQEELIYKGVACIMANPAIGNSIRLTKCKETEYFIIPNWDGIPDLVGYYTLLMQTERIFTPHINDFNSTYDVDSNGNKVIVHYEKRFTKLKIKSVYPELF